MLRLMGERGSAPLGAGTAAWLVALPCTALVALLVALLGDPLGRLLFPPLSLSALLPWERIYFLPEPREEGGYLLALLLPCLIAIATVALSHRRPQLPRKLVRSVVLVTRGALLLLIVASVVNQQSLRYGPDLSGRTAGERLFTPATLAVAGVVALLLALAVGDRTVRRRIAVVLRDTRARRAGAVAIAVAATVLWLLHAINTDASVRWSYLSVWYNLPFSADDTFAVLNGRTPFVDVAPLYASLWPFAAAVPLALFGKTLLVFTLTMCALTAVALLAVFDLLRRVAGSAVGALALYLPFLATSLFVGRGTQAYGYTMATYFAIFPLRYAGPLLLAALTARALDRPGERPAWPLFAAAGLVALNNPNFGLPAFAATLVALGTRATAAGTRLRLLRDAGTGAVLALAAVSCLTLVRAGSLPHLGQLTLYTRYFASGYAATPLPSLIGLHTVFFATYVAAIAVAVVRVQQRAYGALTGMLAWSGVFGLGALSYFVAESGPHWLKANFSAWGLATCLLTVVVVRQLAAAGRRWPGPLELTVLFGVGAMACSLAQLSAPWTQVARLAGDHDGVPAPTLPSHPYVPPQSRRTFVASLADGDAFYLRRGAPVALLLYDGHRIADAYGVVNVSPYANIMSLFAPSFVRTLVADLRRAGGNTVVMPAQELPSPDVYALLAELGFGVVTNDGVVPIGAPGAEPLRESMQGEAIIKLVDLTAPHPRAMQHGPRTLVGRMQRSPW
jgi:hypothetical protein